MVTEELEETDEETIEEDKIDLLYYIILRNIIKHITLYKRIQIIYKLYNVTRLV